MSTGFLRGISPQHWPRRTALACALMASLGALAEPSQATATVEPANDAEVRPGERLSTWLLRQPEDTAAPGLAWRVPQERLAQQFLKNTLLVRLEAASRRAPRSEQLDRLKLITWLQNLPVTGRVALGIVDPRWLQAHPDQDPVLSAGQQLVAPSPQLKTIAVLQPNGELCHVAHEAGRTVWDYVLACAPDRPHDWAWVAQPDGRTSRVGIAPWNGHPSDEPAPGAWIWAAPRGTTELVDASEGIIKFLATQGPSPQTATLRTSTAALAPAKPVTASATTSPALPPVPPESIISVRSDASAPQYKAPRASSNDWGETGLLQTPTARMGEAGDFRTSISHVSPYTRLNVMFQPLDWMEAGFRYTSISNRAYAASTTGQSNKDKSIDVKLRLLRESAYVPQVALGFRDLGGTGLFSAEYLVANKRYGDLDFSLGIGWGYLGNSGNIRNPLLALSNRFRTRTVSSATGGEANFKAFFRGPASLFGGVEWRTPWEPLTVKLEYEGNNYKNEPQQNNQVQRSPFNIGLEYRYSPGVAFTAGLERGNKVMVGLTLSTNMANMRASKPADPPPPRFTPEASANPPGWAATAAEIQARTEWTVQRIAPQGDSAHVWITESHTVYREARVQQVIAVMHRDAPASIKRFILHYNERGLALHTQVVERSEWVTAHYQAQTPAELRATDQRDYAPPRGRTEDGLYAPSLPLRAPEDATVATSPGDTQAMAPWERRTEKFTFGLTPSFSQILGGPDAFLLYQLGVSATAEYRFTPSTWVNAALNWRLLDNFDKFTYTAPSNLPRVRTYQREYATTKRLTMPVFQLTHVGRLNEDQYYSVYGGALESMFAGVGAEWLYRPWRSKFAFGIDVNHVRQRDFAQDLGLRDYKVNTGHATLYWDTGWNGVQARISAGQYLAGDRGVTLDISRRFDNGVTIGAWATKTNVSAAQFGEGSFDKGIYVSIPFDALLPRSSKFTANFAWAPLIRDGGAKLGRINPLFEMTSIRDPKAFSFSPPDDKAPKAGDNILDFKRAQ
ncbi:YjbH domain-containing protein [Variovorax sp. Root473]|uniref:YjbH domain-containing protein n=1 Tax=Variovorax sp. Root473 TaxID=1736541 RepID=UPI0009EBEFE6|nr:YjbH domain-containing protein [Variovorax sp. Root473]